MSKKPIILKEKPWDRSSFSKIYAILDLQAKAESYVFVGSGRTSFEINEKLLKTMLLKADRSFRELCDAILREKDKVTFGFKSLIYMGGRPIIPGSSIKGSVRSRLELSFHSVDNEVPSCYIVSSRTLKREPHKGTHGWRHYKIWGDVIFEERDTCNILDKTFEEARVCPVCNIFGSPGLVSRVYFGDFVPVSKDCIARLMLDYNDRIEAFKPGTVFTGSILIDLEPAELGLVSIGMKLLKNSAILLGYSKYRKRRMQTQYNKHVYLGRISFNPSKMKIPEYFKVDKRGDLLEGSRLREFLKKCENLAWEKWGKWLRDIDEVEKLERIS
ncbi:MAG TPA: hypothetical protein ENG50_05630 [Candidatus Altiarchaeales archaeon]|nr:hypothetical protein [Candidatus Altiarchaeales archaeon]